MDPFIRKSAFVDGKMAQSAMCMPYNHEYMSSSPWNLCKSWEQWDMFVSPALCGKQRKANPGAH